MENIYLTIYNMKLKKLLGFINKYFIFILEKNIVLFK